MLVLCRAANNPSVSTITEKALVGAFFMIVKTDGLFAALHNTNTHFVLLSPPRVGEVERGDPEVDEAAGEAAPVHRLRHQPSHQVLTAARPAVEAENKKIAICNITESSLYPTS